MFRCLLTNWNGIVLHWVPVASCFTYWRFNIAFTEHVYFFVPFFIVFEQTNPELSELMQLPKYHEFAVNLWSVWKFDELPLRFMERFQFRLHFFLLRVCIYKRLGLIMLITVPPRSFLRIWGWLNVRIFLLFRVLPFWLNTRITSVPEQLCIPPYKNDKHIV